MSLIEQLMVAAILATLGGVALPSMAKFTQRSRLASAQFDYLAALNHARQQAILGGRVTTFCPTHDRRACAADTRWEDGWLVLDQPPGQTRLLRTGSGLPAPFAIRSSGGRRAVRFRPDGTAGGSNLTLLLCHPDDAERALTVTVSNAGRIRGGRATPAQVADCRNSASR